MSNSLIVSLAMYIFVTSITPGPNNMLLAASGLTYGLRRTVPQILGICLGFVTLLVLTGFGLGLIIAADPRVLIGLKAVAVLYFLHLTWRLWTSEPVKDQAVGTPIGFWQSAAFQFINPKGLLMAVTVVALFAAPGDGYARSMAIIVLVDVIVGMPCSIAWAVFGATVRRFFSDSAAFTQFNRAMAVLTAVTAVMIITD